MQLTKFNNKCKPGILRGIVEMSCMANNMEVAFIVPEVIKDTFLTVTKEKGYRVVLLRPIHILEPDFPDGQKLYVTESNIDELTIQLDELYKLQSYLDFYCNEAKVSMSYAIQSYIERHYFDCMSGGLWYFTLQILSAIIKHNPDIDKNSKFMDGSTLDSFAARYYNEDIAEQFRLK